MTIDGRGAEHLQTLDTRYGPMSVPSGDADLITNFLRRDGEWAFLEASFIASLLPAKARVLDIGGYLGTFTLGLDRAADLDFACVAEGNPSVVSHLAKNLASNLRCRFEVVGAVVVDPMTAVGAGAGDPNNHGSMSFVAGATGTSELAKITFESLLKRHDAFDLIKADVEGMEEQLLASRPSLLRADRTLVWAECNEAPAAVSLAALLLETGRPLHYFAWPSHNPANHRGNTEPIFPFAYEAGLLLGAETPTLAASLVDAGCLLHRVRTIADIRQCLWRTPRWAPREWLHLQTAEITGMAGHLLLGLKYDSFLIELEGTDGVSTENDQATKAGTQLHTHRIAQLERKVAELSATLLRLERELPAATTSGLAQVAVTPDDILAPRQRSLRKRLSGLFNRGSRQSG